MSGRALPVDPGLLVRFREAGDRIAWRPASSGRAKKGTPQARVAHLNDEEARVEVSGAAPAGLVRTDSGPVGALVLLLEIDRRGPPRVLRTHEAGALPGFPQGALEAAWGPGATPDVPGLPVADLVGLARYALA